MILIVYYQWCWQKLGQWLYILVKMKNWLHHSLLCWNKEVIEVSYSYPFPSISILYNVGLLPRSFYQFEENKNDLMPFDELALISPIINYKSKYLKIVFILTFDIR
jgi:hypothetical protein